MKLVKGSGGRNAWADRADDDGSFVSAVLGANKTIVEHGLGAGAKRNGVSDDKGSGNKRGGKKGGRGKGGHGSTAAPLDDTCVLRDGGEPSGNDGDITANDHKELAAAMLAKAENQMAAMLQLVEQERAIRVREILEADIAESLKQELLEQMSQVQVPTCNGFVR